MPTGEFQSLYLDRMANWCRPDLTFVAPDGSIIFETNEIGLKGDAIDPERKLAVVWGDSVVFGVLRGWACLLDELVPGYQFLNGGIEGDGYEGILQRAAKLNRERAVALNVVLPGWHGHSYALKERLMTELVHVPNVVPATMPTSLNERLLSKDISALLVPGDLNDGFWFYGPYEYSIDTQTALFSDITMRNEATREAAAELGVPVIDLFRYFDTSEMTDFREDFFDIAHPRPRAFPKFARAVYEGIKPLVEPT